MSLNLIRGCPEIIVRFWSTIRFKPKLSCCTAYKIFVTPLCPVTSRLDDIAGANLVFALYCLNEGNGKLFLDSPP